MDHTCPGNGCRFPSCVNNPSTQKERAKLRERFIISPESAKSSQGSTRTDPLRDEADSMPLPAHHMDLNGAGQ